ncbi:hypothetical protein D1871_11175 [Nakamurella silvestris]|nr:hypothetical protein D1871_11175 [Nakamurella silvestris]
MSDTPEPIDEWADQPPTEADLIDKTTFPAPDDPDAPIDLPNDWTPGDLVVLDFGLSAPQETGPLGEVTF